MSTRSRIVTVLALLAFAGLAWAQPELVPMQGYLTDAEGTPIVGSVNLTINVYDAAMDGTVLYGEDQTVDVDQGHFTAYLGSGTASGDPFTHGIFAMNDETWVGIAIDGGVELPRFQLATVPYASHAANASRLGGVEAAGIQNRVNGTCPAGEAIREISATGDVTCQTTSVPERMLVTESQSLANGARNRNIESACPAGFSIISGACHPEHENVRIINQYPNISGNAWRCGFLNSSGTTRTVYVYSVCIR